MLPVREYRSSSQIYETSTRTIFIPQSTTEVHFLQILLRNERPQQVIRNLCLRYTSPKRSPENKQEIMSIAGYMQKVKLIVCALCTMVAKGVVYYTRNSIHYSCPRF